MACRRRRPISGNAWCRFERRIRRRRVGRKKYRSPTIRHTAAIHDSGSLAASLPISFASGRMSTFKFRATQRRLRLSLPCERARGQGASESEPGGFFEDVFRLPWSGNLTDFRAVAKPYLKGFGVAFLRSIADCGATASEKHLYWKGLI